MEINSFDENQSLNIAQPTESLGFRDHETLSAGGNDGVGNTASSPTTDGIDQTEFFKVMQEIFGYIWGSHWERDAGYIGLVRKNKKGDFENLCSLTLSDLETVFDSISHLLEKDAYFTINAMYRTAPHISSVTGLPSVWRRKKHLRYLTSCYVDLDIGRSEGTSAQKLTIEEAVSGIKEMIDNGSLPDPNISVRSGRGLYLFWLLSNDWDDLTPPRAYPERLALYEKIQRRIVQKLSHLAADKGAKDATRVLRIPGTLHSVTNTRAKYLIRYWAFDSPQYSEDNWDEPTLTRSYQKIPKYTLPQLATAFDAWGNDGESDFLKNTRIGRFGRAIAKPGTVPSRAKGARTRAALRAEDMILLERNNGGWKKGTRDNRLWHYASFLAEAGIPRVQVARHLQEMAARCRPPYPSDPNDPTLKMILNDAFSGAHFPGNTSLCEQFEITADLARKLNLKTIVPMEITVERAPIAGGERLVKLKERRTAVSNYIAIHGLVSSRTLARELRKQGFTMSDWTANADLKALGYDTADPARRSGRGNSTKPEKLD